MKFKTIVSNILTNKWILNIVAVLSLFTLIGYLMIRNFNAIAYFIVLSLLLFYFSKNMIIVLGVPLILVNLFVYKNIIKEGLTNNKNSSQNKSTENKPVENKENNKKQKYEKRTPQGLPKTKIDSDTALNSTIDSSDSNTHDTDESFEVGRAKRGGGYNIDYASTVEDAYDELNKIIGGEGIKKLTNDTQSLMKQQLQLAEAMKSMGPLIKGMAPLMQQAQGILGGMKDQEGLGSIMEMAKKFSN